MKKLFLGLIVILFVAVVQGFVLAAASYQEPSQEEIDEAIARQQILVFERRLAVPKDKIFAGWHFVIDVGHGDNDPGAVRVVQKGQKKLVYAESMFTLDIARRLGWYLRQRGDSGVYFTLGPTNLVAIDAIDNYSYWHWANPPPPVLGLKPLLPARPDAPFGDEAILTTRTELGQQKVRAYGERKVIFLSIHVDSASPDVGGISFYTAREGKSQLIFSLKEGAVKADLVRKRKGQIISYFPINKENFVVIQKKYNDAREAILIETANIRNGNFKEGDFAKLISATGREQIAQAVGLGLAMFCQKYD